MRALLTAFAPFRGRDVNQSQSVLEQCLRRLPMPWRAELLPVDLAWVREMAAERAADPALTAWLALGEAGEEGEPRFELQAHNAYDLRDDLASSGAERPQGTLLADGPPLLAATWPSEECSTAMRGRGHALTTSMDAGRHCCNALLYVALHAAAQRTPAPLIGFLHLPRRPAESTAQARLVLDALGWMNSLRRG